VITESIAVRGRAPVAVEMRFTRHGPVTHADRWPGRAYAVRSGWFEPGMAPYFGSIDYMHARDFASSGGDGEMGRSGREPALRRRRRQHRLGAGGLAPVRPNWDGLLPVPATDATSGPASGRASNCPRPSIRSRLAGFGERAEPACRLSVRRAQARLRVAAATRWQRIAEVLQSLPKVSIEDSMRLQNDLLSLPARRLQAVLREVRVSDARARSAARLLLEWNAVESGDSRPRRCSSSGGRATSARA
jgi:penicillin amidase